MSGYDSTGRYHIHDPAEYNGRGDWAATVENTGPSADDQCLECRTPPGHVHNYDCPTGGAQAILDSGALSPEETGPEPYSVCTDCGKQLDAATEWRYNAHPVCPQCYKARDNPDASHVLRDGEQEHIDDGLRGSESPEDQTTL